MPLTVQVPGWSQGPGGDDSELDQLRLRVSPRRGARGATAGHLPQACSPRGAAARLLPPPLVLFCLPSVPAGPSRHHPTSVHALSHVLNGQCLFSSAVPPVPGCLGSGTPTAGV